MKSSEFVIESAQTMTVWHGGNLSGDLGLIPQKNGRFEYGCGLYGTTHYDTAKKYAKGSRKLYRLTIQSGNDARTHYISLDNITGWVNKFVIKTKRTDVLNRILHRVKDGMVLADTINNIILNEKAITASNANKLSKFFVENGIDYLLVPNAFGWGEMMVVVFNLKKVLKIQQVMPKEKITDYDLPTIFSESAQSTLSDFAKIGINMEDADLWLIRKGSVDTVGKPTKEYDPERIGIKITRTDVLHTQYLYYMLLHIFTSGYWKNKARGALRLKNIRIEDVKHIQLNTKG